ncbi:MAG: MATE family efflux transporter [Blautia sp.]|nr:MATE family efflux transporter [Blautia sp.]
MKRDLTKGSILKNLIYFSLPYLLSCFLQTFYGMADLFIAGQFCGKAVITAISTGSQIMHMVTVIIVGLAMGSTVLISQAVGAGRQKEASLAVGNTVTLFLAVAIAATILALLCLGGIIRIMSVPAEAVADTRMYLAICFGGIVFITAYNIISCIFRGLGDSRTPMYFIAIACVSNILLDVLFMGGFRMGAAGAALGTVISQTISVICALAALRHTSRRSDLSLMRADLRPQRAILGRIMKVGVPVALQDGLIQVSFIVITIIANSRGVTIAASVGIVEKIISFLFLIPSAMLSSVSAIAAQNVGANRHDRARKTLGFATAIALGCGLLFALVCNLATEPLIGLFTDDADVIRLGAQYLRTYSFDCAFAGIHFCFSGFFCAYGYSMVSFFHNIASIILVRIPGSYYASKLFPDTLLPMGMAAPLGSLLSALICVTVYLAFRKKGRL